MPKKGERQVFDLLCASCATGFGPKSVTGVIPLPCLFCNNEIQTWYIYDAKRKMKCTNCDAIKYTEKPLVPE